MGEPKKCSCSAEKGTKCIFHAEFPKNEDSTEFKNLVAKKRETLKEKIRSGSIIERQFR